MAKLLLGEVITVFIVRQ